MYFRCGKLPAAMFLVVGVVAAADDRSDLVARLEAALPHLRIAAVSLTTLPDFYEVQIAGQTSVLHVDAQVTHIVAGDLYSVTEDGLVNLSELRREGRRRESFENLDDGTTIAFPAQGDTKATVNVFTDVTCSFCQQFHQEIGVLNRYGIEVRYLAYPRGGPDSETHDLMVSVWCSDNRQLAISKLKSGETISPRVCKNPVRLHWELGRSVGVEGTPTLVTESGRKISGYIPAAELAEKLGLAEVGNVLP